MKVEKKFELIKQLLAEGYEGSIGDIIAQQEQQEVQAMQAQAQAEQQGQTGTPTPALAGKAPTQPQQSSTERNIIQPGQYKKGGYYSGLKDFDTFYKALADARQRNSSTFNYKGEKYYTSTEQKVSFKKGGIKLNYGLGGHDCKECGGFYKTGGGKIKGADGRACWEGFRYAGTENGKDKCVPIEGYKYGGTKEHGGPHDNDSDSTSTYNHIPMDSLVLRQQFQESSFNKKAVSGAGAKGISQITETTYKEGLKKGWIPKGTTYKQLIDSEELSTTFQVNYMDDLTNRSWNKGTDEVKRAKALAAYNMGPTRFVGVLNDMKADGYDIYESMDWLNDLPKYHKYKKGPKKGQSIYESKDYVKTLMYGDHEKKFIETSPDKTKSDTLSWEDRFNRAYNKRFNIKKKTGGYISRHDSGGFDITNMLKFNPEPAVPDTTATNMGSIVGNLPLTVFNQNNDEIEVDGISGETIIVDPDKKPEEGQKAETNILNKVSINMLPFLDQEFYPTVSDTDNTYVHIPDIESFNLNLQIQEENASINPSTSSEIKDENEDISKRRDKNKEKKIVSDIKEEAQTTIEAFNNQYKKVDYSETDADQVRVIQEELVDAGYDLGSYGPNKDGVDGKFGPKTKLAYQDFITTQLKTKTPIYFSPESREESCNEDGCAEYVTNEFIREGYDVDYMQVGGDAWTMYDQIVSNGNGTGKYNIYDQIGDINSPSEARRKSNDFIKNNKPDKGLLQMGDVVGLVYSNSTNWDNAFNATEDGTHFYGDKIKHKTYSSHVGFVSGFDDNGDPIISHNVNGKVYNDHYRSVTGGGISWIASPNSKPSYTYDYSENTTEHDNSDQLNFLDEKNFEGVTNEDGSQKRYSPEVKEVQNNSINFVKNNVPIILDELEIDIKGDDGEEWFQEAVIGVSMVETGMGANLPNPEEIAKDRSLHNAIPFKSDVSLNPTAFSLGITKTKLQGVGQGTKEYYGLNESNIGTDHNRALAVTIDNLARNYAHLQGYAKDNPQLGLTEEDLRNMTILSHNRGLLHKNSAGGGTGVNFGQRNDMTIDQQIESLRSLYEGNMRNVSATNYRFLPEFAGEYLYTREYGEDGTETYISKVNRYIDRQIQTHEELAKAEEERQELLKKNVTMVNPDLLPEKNELAAPPSIAKTGGYRSKYGW